MAWQDLMSCPIWVHCKRVVPEKYVPSQADAKFIAGSLSESQKMYKNAKGIIYCYTDCDGVDIHLKLNLYSMKRGLLENRLFQRNFVRSIQPYWH